MVRIHHVKLSLCLPDSILDQARPDLFMPQFGHNLSLQTSPNNLLESYNLWVEDMRYNKESSFEYEQAFESGSAEAPVEILLVDDDAADVIVTTESISESKFVSRINVAHDGIDAMNYLRQKGEFEHARRPDLVLLDLNLPQKNGQEVLAEIKRDDALKTIPIVVLTTSAAQDDIMKAYELGCNCYITKPIGLNRFADMIGILANFWFTIVKRPPR